mgnify:CR=1 FL=1
MLVLATVRVLEVHVHCRFTNEMQEVCLLVPLRSGGVSWFSSSLVSF